MTQTKPNRTEANASNTTSSAATEARRAYQPRVDIVNAEDAVHLWADMPGVDESEVDVVLDKRTLSIRGSVRPIEFADFHPARVEKETGDYSRSFHLSDEVDREGIEATVKDGVLHLRLPKVEAVLSKKVTVKAG